MKKMSLFLTVLIVTFIVACNQEPTAVSTIVVTEVIESQQTPIVVTRIIEQVVTPIPTFVLEREDDSLPIELDISILGSEPPILDPHANQSTAGITLIENMFAGLTKFNPITQQIEPSLAESWDVSADGREWTFYLRDDIFWIRPQRQETNGLWSVETTENVTANDVVFTVHRACQSETDLSEVVVLFIIEGCESIQALSEANSADLSQIGVEALDDRTVRFTLTKPSAYFLTITSLWYLRPLPKNLIESLEEEEEWLLPENLLTSGPFMPLPNKRTFQRNPAWPIDFLGNVDLVNYFLIENEENAWQLWDAKQIDYLLFSGVVPDESIDEVSDNIELVSEQTLFYLGFNFDSGVFREPNVRRAFSAAIDRQALIEAIYEGQAFSMKHLIPIGVVGALPIDDVGMGYDPDYARIQIAESGFGSCALMPPIRFLVNSSDLSLLQAELIRDMWVEELGCNEQQIIIEQAQFGTVLANTRRDSGPIRPDVWELGWASFYPDAHSWMGELVHCSESENRPNRPCDSVDDLIRAASSEVDFETRAGLYRQIETSLFSRDGAAPLVPLYTPSQTYLVQSWIQLKLANFGGQRFDQIVVDETLKKLERSRVN